MGELAKTFRVPLVTDLVILQGDRDPDTQVLGEFVAYMKNMVAEKLPNGELVARVRPALNLAIQNNTAKSDGRGLFAWEENNTLYIVNDDTIYRNSYLNTVGTISAGTQRVNFTQVGTRLFLTDHQNNNAWTLQTNHTLAQVTDPDFPSTLAAGVVTLNGRAYVMDNEGSIYGSALDDATSWDSLNVINAERRADRGIYLGFHHDHIVAFGSQTIEFFYDNGNATGSPLSRREDVFHNIGAVLEDAVWQYQDDIYFLGRDFHGAIGIYRLRQFSLEKVSTSGIDSCLDLVISDQNDYVFLSGMQGIGKTFILVNLCNTDLNAPNNYGSGSGYQKGTFAYDTDTGLWSLFAFGQEDATFPLVAWTQKTAVTNFPSAYGIYADGTVYRIQSESFVDDDSAASQNSILVQVRTGWHDGGTNKYKYCRALELVANPADDITATISYSDTTNLSSAYTTGRTLSCTADTLKRKLTRLGRFIRRNWNISASVTDEVRLEALELEVALGDV